MRRIEGQIRKALSGFYYVASEGKIHQTRARGNFRKKKLTPLVGDEVVLAAKKTARAIFLNYCREKMSWFVRRWLMLIKASL